MMMDTMKLTESLVLIVVVVVGTEKFLRVKWDGWQEPTDEPKTRLINGPPPLAPEFRNQVNQACARAMSQGGRAFLNDDLECELDDPDKLGESSSDDDEPDSKPNDIRDQVFTMRPDASDCDITLETLHGQLNYNWFETYINALRCIC